MSIALVKLRRKVEPIWGVQRPDGGPNSTECRAFIQTVNDMGGTIAVVPNTNYMYLIKVHPDRLDGATFIGPIQPGHWVIKTEGRCVVATATYIAEEFERVFDPFV